MGAGHAHGPVGDPAAPAALRALCERLEAAMAANPGGTDLAPAADRDDLERWRADLNPRTRAQVRGLMAVLDLWGRGEHDAARDLLAGELRRSFPGQAEVILDNFGPSGKQKELDPP